MFLDTPDSHDDLLMEVARSTGGETPMADESAPDLDDSCEIEQELEAYGRYWGRRDDLIRQAKKRGISEVRIARLMGHSRTTIRKALL